MKHIACFISSHGFGHATRCCAVLAALQKQMEINIHIFTTVDQPLFAQTLKNFTYHRECTDVGFMQKDALCLDIPATLAALNTFYPLTDTQIDRLVRQCKNIDLIYCDISSLGIAVAKRAGIPSILLENFTWEYLYNTFEREYPQFQRYSAYLQMLYQQATYHIQTEPLCLKKKRDLLCGPIARPLQKTKEETLAVFSPKKPVVLITLGGISFTPTFLDLLLNKTEYFFLITGQGKEQILAPNVHILAKTTSLYHPDLIRASDIVVFKSGYSTLAECYQCSAPSLIITRNGFAESKAIEDFAAKNMHALFIKDEIFREGSWLECLDTLQDRKINHPAPPVLENGAHHVAEFIANLLNLQTESHASCKTI